MMSKYTFDSGTSSFFKILRQKVDDYFAGHKIAPVGNRRLLLKGSLMVFSAILIYSILVFFTPITSIAIALCVVLGINLALIGFNVMHEGGHECFSKYPWINKMSAYFLNVLGGNIYFWKLKHNVNHHTYTNVEGMDADIDIKPFMRLHEGQPLRWYHRFQHLYWIILYALSYLTWIFYDDFQKYFSGRVTPNSKRKKLPLKEHIIFWFTKLMYVGVYMVVPILLAGWLQWLVGFLIITFTCGLIISVVFQLAHVVEDTQFHSLEHQDMESKQEWALHQLASTANFATSSRWLHWHLGGLNFQIEHHLFPRISHVHYPVISQFVKETCKEYSIAHHEYSSMLKAIMSHFYQLYRLGNPVRT